MLLAGGIVGTAGLGAKLVLRVAGEVTSARGETGEGVDVGLLCAFSPEKEQAQGLVGTCRASDRAGGSLALSHSIVIGSLYSALRPA